VAARFDAAVWAGGRIDHSPVVESWTDKLTVSADVHAGVGGGVEESFEVEEARHESGLFSVTITAMLGGALGLGALKFLKADATDAASVMDTYQFASKIEADEFRTQVDELLALIAAGGPSVGTYATRLALLLASKRGKHTGTKVQSDTGVTIHAGIPAGVEGIASAHVEAGAGVRIIRDLRTGDLQVGRYVDGSFDVSGAAAPFPPGFLPVGIQGAARLDGDASALYHLAPDGELQSLEITVSGVAEGGVETGGVHPWEATDGRRVEIGAHVDLSSSKAKLAALRLETAMGSHDPVATALAIRDLTAYCDQPDVRYGAVQEVSAGVETPIGGAGVSSTHYTADGEPPV
jgi:hypothetical protein